MLASRRPSIGEILSILAPPPRHSPSNTPALSSVRPSFSKGVFIGTLLSTAGTSFASPLDEGERWSISRSFSFAAKLPHQLHRFIDSFCLDVERRTETDRVFAGAKRQNTKVEEAVPKFFPRFRIGEIEREEYSAAARCGNQRLFRLQIAQLIEEIRADFRRILDQAFLLDDAQIMR